MPKSTDATPLVSPTGAMSDENIVRHFRSRHPETFHGAPLNPTPDPDRAKRGEQFRLVGRRGWELAHAYFHRSDGAATHRHDS